MTPTRWWVGIILIVLAILAHAALPRYEWRQIPDTAYYLRVDRWTGVAEIGQLRGDWGRWVSNAEFARASARGGQ